jgi:hypothetical protein
MKVKSSLHHSDECECQCSLISLHSSQPTCGASSKVYKGIDMWQMIVCEKLEEEEWHKKNVCMVNAFLMV